MEGSSSAASSSSAAVQPVTAMQLLKRNRNPETNTLPPRLPILMNHSNYGSKDEMKWLCLDGNRGITEISGEAGTGKTQLALSLLVTSVLQKYSYNLRDPGKDDDESFAFGNDQSKHDQSPLIPKPYRKASLKRANGYASSAVSSNIHGGARGNSDTSVHPQPSRQQYYEAMYISMGETTSPAQIAHRIHQMTQQRLKFKSQMESPPESTRGNFTREQKEDEDENVKLTMKRIHTRFVHNEEDFMELLKLLPSILQTRIDQDGSTHKQMNMDSASNGRGTNQYDSVSSRIGLIVLDSVAGLFRTPQDISMSSENDPKRRRTGYASATSSSGSGSISSAPLYYAQRSEMLFQISAKLKQISDQYGVHIVVINQVTGKGSGKVVPALGLSWSNCVNDRFLLGRRETVHNHNNSSDGRGVKFERNLSILTSSRWKDRLQIPFRIQTIGVVLD